jgi:hypothetical protein
VRGCGCGNGDRRRGPEAKASGPRFMAPTPPRSSPSGPGPARSQITAYCHALGAVPAIPTLALVDAAASDGQSTFSTRTLLFPSLLAASSVCFSRVHPADHTSVEGPEYACSYTPYLG